MSDTLSLKFAALADPTRRAILARLACGETSVAMLHQPFAISQPAISKHLKLLEQAGLIETMKCGQARPRRLKPDGLAEAVAWVAEVRAMWDERFDRLDMLLAKLQKEGAHGQ